jgi:hypothetical protein
MGFAILQGPPDKDCAGNSRSCSNLHVAPEELRLAIVLAAFADRLGADTNLPRLAPRLIPAWLANAQPRGQTHDEDKSKTVFHVVYACPVTAIRVY